MIRLLLWFFIFLFLVRTMQLIWRVSQRPKKKDTRTPEFDKIEEAHFEDITDHPDDSTPPPSSKE